MQILVSIVKAIILIYFVGVCLTLLMFCAPNVSVNEGSSVEQYYSQREEFRGLVGPQGRIRNEGAKLYAPKRREGGKKW